MNRFAWFLLGCLGAVAVTLVGAFFSSGIDAKIRIGFWLFSDFISTNELLSILWLTVSTVMAFVCLFMGPALFYAACVELFRNRFEPE